MTIATFLNKVDELVLNPIILLAFAVSFLYFVYGIVKFLSSDVADKTRKESQDAILYGIVGMIIMFSVFGLIRFTLGAFGVSTGDSSLQNAKPYLNLP